MQFSSLWFHWTSVASETNLAATCIPPNHARLKHCTLYTNSPLFIVHCTHWYTFGKHFCKVQSGQNIAFPDAGQSQFCKKFTKNTEIPQTQIQEYHKHKYKNTTKTNTPPKNKIASLASHIESMLSQSSKKFAKWRCHDAVFLKTPTMPRCSCFEHF